MFEYLSENEIIVLEFLKEEYDRRKDNPVVSVDFKANVKIKEDVPKVLEEKGYIEIKKTAMGDRMQIVSITLKDKFFVYFNI